MNTAVHASHLCQEREDGNQTYIKQLFRSIREETSEHAFWFYYNKPECKRIEASNFYHIHEEAPLAWTQRVFPSLLRRDAPDILFMPIQMMPIRKPRHLPSVVTIHDLAFLYYPRTFPLKDRVLHRLYVRWAVKHATHLIAISQATKDDIIKHYNVPEERISVVYHGIDRERFRLPQDSDNQRITQVQTKYGITKPYLLYIGNVQPRKNITNLVRAFHHMKEAGYTDMQLVIAGAQAWRVQDIFDSLGEHGTHEDLIFTGRFEDADLPPLLWGSRGFILPSFYEGFGLPILEAFACGV
ncbi:MAG: glycosyltransferase family 4 protein, partial [Candidatus Paceibacteria bacterium]